MRVGCGWSRGQGGGCGFRSPGVRSTPHLPAKKLPSPKSFRDLMGTLGSASDFVSYFDVQNQETYQYRLTSKVTITIIDYKYHRFV